MSDLYGNQSAGSWAWNLTADAPRSWATRFQVTAAGTLTQAGFYRGGTGTTWPRLALYAAPGTLLWEDATPTDSGAVGWQWTAIDPPVEVVPGTTYSVSGSYTANVRAAANGTPASRSSPPTPFIFDDTPCHMVGTAGVYPTSPNTGIYLALSVTFAAAPPPPPGPGEGDPTTTGDLNSWLSADPAVQTHEADGLPWLTKLQTDVIENAVDAGRIVIDATHDIVELIPKRGDSEWNAILKLWQIAGVLTEAEIDLWNLFAKRAPGQLTGTTPGGGSAFFGPSGGQVAERAEVAATNGELLWHRTQTTNWLDPLPGGDWVLQDTLTWDGPIGWNQPADCYVLHITTYPATWDQQDVDGHLRLPRALWWAPLTDTIPHERHFGDMEFQILHDLPRRCAGILLAPKSGFSGTLEAWLRPTPPAAGIPVPPVP